MKQLLLLLTLALFTSTINGQSLFQKKADQLYNELSYIAAADYYKSLVKTDSPTEANMRKLAECYFKIYDFVKAEDAYKNLNTKFAATITEADLINYLQCVKYNQKYQDAQTILAQLELKRKDNLKCHLKIHIPNRHRPFECDRCHRGYLRHVDLLRHIETVHLGVRRHFCRNCNKAFTRKEGLRIHSERCF